MHKTLILTNYTGINYSLIRKKSDSTILKNFVREKFRKQFYFFTCILTDYLTHESLKVFWKNSDFENMGASFLRRCQNTLWQNSPEMMHFQAWKKKVFGISFDSIKKQIRQEPQKDCLNLSFVKDFGVVSLKMARNGHKMVIYEL